MHAICLIVPCYNEAHRFPKQVFEEFFGQHPEVSFCLVDDGSTDGTWPMLEQIASAFPQVSTLKLPANVGKGETVRQGILSVVQNEAFQWLGYLDADAATPPNEILYMLAQAQGQAKLLMGSRLQRLGSQIYRSKRRHYVGRIFSTLASMALELPVYDTQCGAKLIERKLAQSLFHQPFKSQWLFDIELLFRYKAAQGTVPLMQQVQEIPLNCWQEKSGGHLRLSDMIMAPFALFRLWWEYRC